MKKWLWLFLGLMVMMGMAVWLAAGQRPLRAESSATAVSASSGRAVHCHDGLAGIYPCNNVDLLAHLPLSAIGAEDDTIQGNDHWGWTDPETGRDYVLFGLTNGTSFIDITDRENPVYLGKLPAHNPGELSVYWDVKVYENYAYIVGDVPSHNGLQIFDLTQLRHVTSPPVIFSETGHYDGFGAAHNLWVNEETGFLYVMRSDVCPTVIILDLSNPTVPTPTAVADDGVPGCFVDEPQDKLTSDALCTVYNGPDADYAGHELCFIGSDRTLSIADVTNKAQPTVITNTLGYTEHPVTRLHQGALTADQRYLLFSDVSDEMTYHHNTRTYVWDLADMDAAVYIGYYEAAVHAHDHNLYIIGPIAYETNFTVGLRLLDIRNLPDTNFLEVGYFDVLPGSDSPAVDGAWSNYPWWSDGAVTVSTTGDGLFILQPTFQRQHLPLMSKR